MAFLKLLLIGTVLAASTDAAAPQVRKCLSPPAAPARIEKVINECQDDIKFTILEEALSVLGDSADVLAKEVKSGQSHRSKRETFTEEERRIAGCLLHCVYRKVKALDTTGLPTGEGLVNLYSEGVQDPGYFLATAQAVNHCMGAAKHQGRLQPSAGKDKAERCYLAYDLFECVSDQILEYCGATP